MTDLTIRVGARNETGGVFATVSRDVERLKRTLGSGSEFGQLMALARGGGAAAGVIGLVRALGDVADAFNRANEEGKSFFATLQENLERNILAGTFIRAGAAINELFTGDQAYTRELQRQAAQSQKRLDEARRRREVLAGVESEQDLERSLGQVLPAGIGSIEQLRNAIATDEAFLRTLPRTAADDEAAFSRDVESRRRRLEQYRKVLEDVERVQVRLARVPFMPPDMRDPLLEAILANAKADDRGLGAGGLVGPGVVGVGGWQLSQVLQAVEARQAAAGTLADLLEQQLSASAGAAGSRFAALRGAAFSSGLQSRGLVGVGAAGIAAPVEDREADATREAIEQLREIARKQSDAVDLNTKALRDLAEQYKRLLTPDSMERIFN